MLRLAVAQSPAALSGTAARLHWLAGILPDLTKQAVDLVLLPELFATGYNIGADIPSQAETADGAIASQVAMLAREAGLAIHYGYVEESDGQLYNSAQCFGADGVQLVHQRKLAIPPGFEGEYFTPGRGCNLFSLQGFTIATLICYDVEFPETVRHVARLGADLVLAPTALGANWGFVADNLIPSRAFENGVFLAYSNSVGAENGMSFLGQSVVVAPDGVELGRAGFEPEVLTADLELARVAAAQSRLPYFHDVDRLALD